MSTCSIPYIEDLTLESREEKDRLTALHIKISRQLYSHRIHNKDYKNQIFTFAGNRLFVPGEKAYYNEAKTLIDNINNDLGFVGVTLVQDTTNPMRRYVSVDVRPDRSAPLDPVDAQTFLKNYFGDSDIVMMSEEFEDFVPQHEKEFKELTDSIRQKASIYLKGLEKSGDYFRGNKTKKELEILLGSLKDKSTYGILESISKYIMMSSYNLNNLRMRLVTIEKKMKDLSKDESTRKVQLEEISNFVRHSSYYYHLFDLLDDFKHDLKTIGADVRPIDNYERDLLEKDLREFMEKEHIPETQILDFLNNVPTLLGGDIKTAFKAVYKSLLPDPSLLSNDKVEQLENDLRDILDKNIKKDGGLHQKLLNTIDELGPFKIKLKELHYDTLVEIYYPTFEKTFKDVGEKRTIDGKEKLADKYKISKEDFRTLLQIGEEDISTHSRWGSAMINVNETVMNTIANYFKDVMIDIDIKNKEDIRQLQDFLTKHGKTQEDLTEQNRRFVTQNAIIEDVVPVDDTYIPATGEEIIEIKTFGKVRRYKARSTKNFITEFNTIAYTNNKKVFEYHVDEVAGNYANLLASDPYSLTFLQNIDDPLYQGLFKSLYQLDDEGDIYLKHNIGAFLNSKPTLDEVKERLKTLLSYSFYAENLSLKDAPQLESIMKENGVIVNGKLVDLEDDAHHAAKQHTLSNVHWRTYKEKQREDGSVGSSLKTAFIYNPETLFGKYNAEIKQVLVKFTDNTLGYIELLRSPDDVFVFNTSGKEIKEFGTFTGDYSGLAIKYHTARGGSGTQAQIDLEWKNKDAFNKEYYDRLIKLYKDANRNLNTTQLKHFELPQVQKLEETSNIQRVKQLATQVKQGQGVQMMQDYAKTYLAQENKIPKTNAAGEFINEDGEVVETPIYVSSERQYINGQRIRDIAPKFIKPVPIQNLETDLYKSVLLYKTASNSFRGLKANESQALLLQTILEGDAKIGIDPRKVKVKQNEQDVIVPGGTLKFKDTDLNSTKLMLSFINDYVYGIEGEDYSMFGFLSARRVTQVMSGYTAYAALAFNVMTMPSNRLISVANTRAVSKGNEFFNETDWKEAVKVYHANYGGFFNDFKSKGFTNQKSPITQLLIRFNGMQGEFLKPDGTIQSKNVAEKISDSALMWTQELVEHANQTESMIMLMMGYKLPSGVSLWQAIQDANVNRKDGESMIMPTEFTTELEIEFQKRLQGVNRQIHGNYGKLDKNDLQRGAVSNMFMMFRKYIYDGFRSRFQEARWDQEIKDEQEGYFRTYLKSLNKEFSETAKTQGLLAALKSNGAATVGRSLLKTTLAGWDAAFGRVVSKNNAGASEYLYGVREEDGGDITDKQYYAAIRATYEVGNVIRMMLLAAAVEALMSGLDEDDEELKFVLSYIDLYSRKLEGDIGFFTSFTNFGTGIVGGQTLDQMFRILKNPFAASRSIDNTAGIFTQLIDFDFVDSEGNATFKWGALDKYEKSGNGFEKGDYKIARKFEKSIFSPWWQIVKLANPEEQLKYMNMIYKHSE